MTPPTWTLPPRRLSRLFHNPRIATLLHHHTHHPSLFQLYVFRSESTIRSSTTLHSSDRPSFVNQFILGRTLSTNKPFAASHRSCSSFADPGYFVAKMTTSKRLADKKSAKFQKNVHRRGNVPETTLKKKNQYPVGPMVLGLFVFVVIGSSIIQIFRSATSGGMA